MRVSSVDAEPCARARELPGSSTSASNEKEQRQEEDEGRPQHRRADDEVVEHVDAERERGRLRR